MYRIAGRDGGSVSCCIGLIWLSPRSNWTPTYYAEMLVHEFVHNSVFLEDMVRGIMPNSQLLEHDGALTISVLRKTRRPYDKAFHSACVAVGLMLFYHSIGQDSVAENYLGPLRTTIEGLVKNDSELHRQGLDLLTDNGRQILNELQRFANQPDYDMIAEALATDWEPTPRSSNID